MKLYNNLLRRFPWLIFIASVCFCLLQLIFSWNKTILDEYAFRQTQTAISAYWIIKGGSWIAYPTPVLGPPWSIPFEFPIYQWLVAILTAKVHLLTLDQSGRVISELFFIACIWPLWRLATHLEESKSALIICLSLLFFSPLYVFWSRSFMMESTVLFFSLWYVAALSDFMAAASTFGFFEMVITAAFAALIKITTFVGFSFAGALIVLFYVYKEPKSVIKMRPVIKYALVLSSIIVSIALLELWVHYSDALKSSNLIGKNFTSESLTGWNFGTLKQRYSAALMKAIFVRAPNEALGVGIISSIIMIAGLIISETRVRIIAASLITLYVLPFFVFTNLHIIHHYYQYANSIFLVLALGVLVHGIHLKNRILGVAVLIFCVSTQMYGFYKYFYPEMITQGRTLQTTLASYIRQNTTSQQIIIGFGLSWSSEVPYYSQRRALLVPDRIGGSTLSNIAKSVAKIRNNYDIGAVIVCPNKLSTSSDKSHAYNKLLSVLINNKRRHTVGYCSIYN